GRHHTLAEPSDFGLWPSRCRQRCAGRPPDRPVSLHFGVARPWFPSRLSRRRPKSANYAPVALQVRLGWHIGGQTAMISITQVAANKVREIAEGEGLIGQGLRLRVIGGGCAGFQYDLYFEEAPTDFDE